MLFLGWLLIAACGYFLAATIGGRNAAPNDGCLWGFFNILLTLFGGSAGLLIGEFPATIAWSLALAAVLPALSLVWMASQLRKR